MPPGPKGLPVVGMALSLRSDPLARDAPIAREYGDIVRFHVMMQERILLNHPDFIEQVLVDPARQVSQERAYAPHHRANARPGLADQRRRFLAAAAAPRAARIPSQRA